MSTNLKAMVKALVSELAECQPALLDIYLYRSIAESIGIQLDKIGDIVGELRAGRSDTDYRNGILFRIYQNNSSGEPETLIQAFKISTGSTNVFINEIYPARVELMGDGDTVPSWLSQSLNRISAGGVSVIAIVAPDIDYPFIWDDENGMQNLPGRGWNEVVYTEGGVPVGGQLVEAIS